MKQTTMDEVNLVRLEITPLVHNVQNYTILNVLYSNPYLQHSKFLELIRFFLISFDKRPDWPTQTDMSSYERGLFIAQVIDTYMQDEKLKFLEAKEICLRVYDNVFPFSKPETNFMDFFLTSTLVQEALKNIYKKRYSSGYKDLLNAYWLEGIHTRFDSEENKVYYTVDFVQTTKTSLLFVRNFGSVKNVFDRFFGRVTSFQPDEKERRKLIEVRRNHLFTNYELISFCQTFIFEGLFGVSHITSILTNDLVRGFMHLDNIPE